MLVGGAGPDRNAGIVVGAVEPAVAGDDGGNEVGHVLGPRHVGGDEVGRPAGGSD
jgi:hypothetical protein